MTVEPPIQAFLEPISLFGKNCHLSVKKCRIFHLRTCYDANVDQLRPKEKENESSQIRLDCFDVRVFPALGLHDWGRPMPAWHPPATARCAQIGHFGPMLPTNRSRRGISH
jgi:hypothetical protein